MGGLVAFSSNLPQGDLWQNWTSGRDVFDKLLLDSDWAVNNGSMPEIQRESLGEKRL